MANSKKEEFSQSDRELSELAKAISHPARIAILRILAARNTCLCGEIVLELPLSQSTVSQHLKALKEAGLIQGEIEGPRVCYCLDQSGITKLSSLFSRFSERVSKGKERESKCC